MWRTRNDARFKENAWAYVMQASAVACDVGRGGAAQAQLTATPEAQANRPLRCSRPKAVRKIQLAWILSRCSRQTTLSTSVQQRSLHKQSYIRTLCWRYTSCDQLAPRHLHRTAQQRRLGNPYTLKHAMRIASNQALYVTKSRRSEPVLDGGVLLLECLDFLVLRCIICNRDLIEAVCRASIACIGRQSEGPYGFSGDFWNCLYRSSCKGRRSVRWEEEKPSTRVD